MTAASQEKPQTTQTRHHQILIIGGGAAGITTAAQLHNRNPNFDLAIIEPSEKHYYQPGWTLVGGGVFTVSDTEKDEKDCIPPGTTWIKDSAAHLDPDNNTVTTTTGIAIRYDYLIVAAGIQINWHWVEGLPEALGKGGVTSNYSKEYAPYTWETLNNFQGGNAIFTQPGTPIKCAGAPQKIMYLADDIFRSKMNLRQRTQVIFCNAGKALFGAPDYRKTLEKIVQERDIEVKLQHNLKAINAANKEAIFTVTQGEETQEITIPYDMIHVTPPMSAPDFIKNSPLANEAGWVNVDKDTTQHLTYPNVFSLGDASSLPTSKTAAAVRGQAPVLVENLLAEMAKQGKNGKYNGYTCCPLITGYGTTIMAEFDYNKEVDSSFPFDPTQERYDMWIAKTKLLPWLYWNRMLKGKPFEGKQLKKVFSR